VVDKGPWTAAVPTPDARGIELAARHDEDLQVLGNPEQLFTAVSNLVENAVAYSPERSKVAVIVERARLGSADDLDGPHAIVMVSDQASASPRTTSTASSSGSTASTPHGRATPEAPAWGCRGQARRGQPRRRRFACGASPAMLLVQPAPPLHFHDGGRADDAPAARITHPTSVDRTVAPTIQEAPS
jgi:hypothetical protein